MIEKLTASAFFPLSGATLKADYQPQTGVTAVVGENGTGKTFLSIEVTRWLLYGKPALRGAAADYKQAEAAGTFLIRGARYEISRGKHEWIKDASGAVVAKGAEKVTEYVTQIMGYGLDVFDLCNAATQGDVQVLGKMRPAERKAIIDKVAKLTSAEAAEKDCRTEASGYKREVEALTKLLRAPGDEPPLPSDLTILRAGLELQRDLRRDLVRLESQLTKPFPPATPDEARPTATDIAVVERYVDEQRELHARHRDLGLASRSATYSVEQLDAAERRLRVRKVIDARGDRPTLTADEVAHGFDQHRAALAHKASEPVTCPKCDHTFRPTGEAPPEPTWSRLRLEVEEQRLRAWPDDGPALPEGIDLTTRQIEVARAALAAQTELSNLPPLGPDKSGQLAVLRRRFHHWEVYEQSLVAYDAEVARNAAVQAQIAQLGYVPTQDDVDALNDALRAAEATAAAHEAWQREDAAYKELRDKITEAQYLHDEYIAGAKGIADARAVVKALLAPKISRIATELIRDMSLGKLTDLIVDDNMEITVGGQRIETLSGAGKTVANLALRIAMGRALVGHVFPVFLADEIDGDLSAARREATLQAMASLKKHLSQIILVTHRGADIADQVWNVEQST